VGALTKIAQKGIESVSDFLKSFSDKTYYHGSPDSPDIKKFDARSREATYFTANPEYASGHAEQPLLRYVDAPDASTVYPVKIKTDEIFDYSDKKSWQKLFERDEALEGPTGTETLEDYMHHFDRQFNASKGIRAGEYRAYEGHVNFLNYLKERGFRGYTTNEPETVALFYPDKGDVRSIFAKFDPAKSKSGNILASVPVVGLSGYGALEMLGEENGQSSN
jgi:hypothetical protein